MHYFKLNIGDYHKKAGRLTMLQHGAYTLLLHSCYDREKFPTEQEAIEWCWACTDEEIAAVKFVIHRFFTEENGRFVQHRIAEEIAEYHAKCETNRAIAVQREARKRTSRAKNSTKREPVVHESPPNHKPITNNQSKGGRFTPPSVKEVEEYCASRKNNISAQTFVDFYAAKGWMVGNSKMKDWQACVRTWESRQSKQNNNSYTEGVI